MAEHFFAYKEHAIFFNSTFELGCSLQCWLCHFSLRYLPFVFIEKPAHLQMPTAIFKHHKLEMFDFFKDTLYLWFCWQLHGNYELIRNSNRLHYTLH